jgi:hypothetical protein
MNRSSIARLAGALALAGWGVAIPASAAELKGAAILDHACGKVAVRQMGLIHAGKFDDANKLSTKELQAEWNAMPGKDRDMMKGLMKELSEPEAKFAAGIRADGVLVENGQAATLTVKKVKKDANGSSTSTTTHQFRMNGGECLVSR